MTKKLIINVQKEAMALLPLYLTTELTSFGLCADLCFLHSLAIFILW